MTKSCLILGLAVLLTNCAAPLALSDLKAVPQGEAVVFGRVEVIWEGKPIVWPETGFRFFVQGPPSIFQIFILPDSASEEIHYVLSGDGSFYWHLPPGGYTVTGFQRGASGGGFYRGRIFALFTVPQEQSVVYLGTLTLDFFGKGDQMRVKDEYDQALQGVKSKFPELGSKAAKNLMQLEKPL